jgi:single-strand DNA-binding protein
MLNKVILMGRITRDLELRQTPQGTAVLTFTIAVDRSFVRQGEERQADFITCVAWRNQAEFINRYFSKGRMIAIVGNIRTRNYEDKNGVKHYVTEVFVDEASFTGEPKQQGGYQQGGYPQNNGYQQNNNSYQQPQQANNYQSNAPQPDDSVNIGDFQDFDMFSDDGVPF